MDGRQAIHLGASDPGASGSVGRVEMKADEQVGGALAGDARARLQIDKRIGTPREENLESVLFQKLPKFLRQLQGILLLLLPSLRVAGILSAMARIQDDGFDRTLRAGFRRKQQRLDGARHVRRGHIRRISPHHDGRRQPDMHALQGNFSGIDLDQQGPGRQDRPRLAFGHRPFLSAAVGARPIRQSHIFGPEHVGTIQTAHRRLCRRGEQAGEEQAEGRGSFHRGGSLPAGSREYKCLPWAAGLRPAAGSDDRVRAKPIEAS